MGQPEAMDVETGESLCRLGRETPLHEIITVGGGLLVAAEKNCRLPPIDQWAAQNLWTTIPNRASDMAPISFGVNAKQYFAVLAPFGT